MQSFLEDIGPLLLTECTLHVTSTYSIHIATRCNCCAAYDKTWWCLIHLSCSIYPWYGYWQCNNISEAYTTNWIIIWVKKNDCDIRQVLNEESYYIFLHFDCCMNWHDFLDLDEKNIWYYNSFFFYATANRSYADCVKRWVQSENISKIQFMKGQVSMNSDKSN